MTETTAQEPALVDPSDRSAFIEEAQRAYATEHEIDLTEEEFALAAAKTLVYFQRGRVPVREAVVVKRAQGSVRDVAHNSGRRRPLGRAERVELWLWPFGLVLMTGFGLWALRDVKKQTVHSEHPSWLPDSVVSALPGHLTWFEVLFFQVGAIATVVALVAAGWATFRPQTSRNMNQVTRSAIAFATIMFLVIAASAMTYGVVVMNLAIFGAEQ